MCAGRSFYRLCVFTQPLSPKRIIGGLGSDYIGPEYRAKLQAALDAVPPEGKTPEALARQFSFGGLVGAGAAAAALAAANAAEAAPSQGSPPMAAGLAAIDPADLARLFGRVPLGAPQGFTGTSGATVQPEGADTAAPGLASRMVPLPPARPDDAALSAAPAAPQADLPVPGAVPVIGRAPAGLASPGAAAPALPVAAPAAPAASPEGPSFGDRLLSGARDFRANGGFDYLGAIGAGLLSSPTWGGGLSAGMQMAQRGETQKAATDLARAEYGLKTRRLAQETARENQTAKVIATKLGIPVEQAAAFASNPEFVNGFLRSNYGVPEGYTRSADGSLSPVAGGEKDPATIRARAQAAAEGTAAGGKDDVQIVTRPDGSIVAVNKSGLGEAGAAPAVTTVAPGASKLSAEAVERRHLLIDQGMDPKDPRNEDYILTGKRPREDQAKLTAADKKVINEAEDQDVLLGQTIDTLKRAKELNGQTFTGATAGIRGKIGTSIPGAGLFLDPKASEATREFGQLMSMEAIKAMSQTLKGATTDREMDRFMDILGDPATPPDIRARTLDRMHTLAIRQQQLAQSRMRELRDGTYYRTEGQQTVPSGPVTGARRRFDPATGGFN